MIKILIGLLVALIVMVQVFYLERLTKHRRLLLLMFTLILSVGLYYALRDPVAAFAHKIDSMDFTQGNQKISLNATQKDYDNWYVQAMMAYDQQDYPLAMIYFHQLYDINPKDQSYFREYADLLLSHDPKSPILPVLMKALKEQPEQDAGWLLLFARYEQLLGNRQEAEKLYQEALKKL